MSLERKTMQLRLPYTDYATDEDFIEDAMKVLGGPRVAFDIAFPEAMRPQFQAQMNDPELTNQVMNAPYWALLRLITGDDTIETMEDMARLSTEVNENRRIAQLMVAWLHLVHVPKGWASVFAHLRFDPEDVALIDFPDHPHWNDNERLALKFIAAAINYEMTDELFAATTDALGIQLTLRCLMWTLWYQSLDVFVNVVGITEWVGPLKDPKMAARLANQAKRTAQE